MYKNLATTVIPTCVAACLPSPAPSPAITPAGPAPQIRFAAARTGAGSAA
jgi:hypothetical protein